MMPVVRLRTNDIKPLNHMVMNVASCLGCPQHLGAPAGGIPFLMKERWILSQSHWYLGGCGVGSVAWMKNSDVDYKNCRNGKSILCHLFRRRNHRQIIQYRGLNIQMASGRR